MATITHVFTIARVAEMLGVDEDRLHEIAIEMEPEDGVMHVYGIDDDAYHGLHRLWRREPAGATANPARGRRT